MTETFSETVLSTIAENDSLPSDIIVQRQLQDVILTQKAAIHRLYDEISLQETSLRESFTSRDTYEEELRKLERTIQEDYVRRRDHEDLQQMLEAERVSHTNTKRQLNDVQDRLEFALGQVEVLTKQLEREKAAFEKAFGSIRSKAMEETSKNYKLETKCSEISKQVKEKEEKLSTKDEEIKNLEQKLKSQEITYKKQLTDAEIQRRQEQYISKLLEEQEKKKSRLKVLGVPKQKCK